MKIAMFTWSTVDVGVGGVEGHVHFLSRELELMGHQVKVFTLSERVAGRRRSAPKAVRLSTKLVNETILGFMERIVDGIRLRRFWRSIDRELVGFDVVHFHDFIRIIPIARKLAKRHTVVWTNHLGEFIRLMELPGGKQITRALTRQFHGAIGPSTQLASAEHVSPPIVYISNGVDLVKFPFVDSAKKVAAKKSLGLSPDSTLVLVPRRWAPTKGVLEAAGAARLLQGSGFTFAFLGSAGAREYPSYGRSIATELAGLDDLITLPHVDYDDMSLWLASSDMVLIPSKLEATSLSALEAMATGAIVIASRAGGLSQLIEDSTTGFLLDEVDAETIASLIRDVSNRATSDLDRIRSEAHRTVRASHSWSHVAQETVGVYLRAQSARLGESLNKA